MPKGKTTALTESAVSDMIVTRDFSSTEGRVPEFIAMLLQATPTLMKQALSVALENEKIRKETNKYIHTTSNAVVKEYTAIVKLEQQDIIETNKRLGDVLVQLGKKDELTPDEVTIYFETLRTIQRNGERMSESVQQSKQFIEDIYEKEISVISKNPSPTIKALLQFAKTPEGTKLIISLGKLLYSSYVVIRK